MFGRLYSTRQKYAAAIFRAYTCARVPHVTILNSHFLGGAKLRLECNTAKHVKKELRQVNKKFCELKGGHIGIVEKAQETRFGMSPKYSRYIGIAS